MLLFEKARKCGGPLVGPTAANVENYVAWLEECLSHVEFACNTMFPLLQSQVFSSKKKIDISFTFDYSDLFSLFCLVLYCRNEFLERNGFILLLVTEHKL